jgi:hypothetical protein
MDTPAQGSPRTVPVSGPGAPTLYLARPLPVQAGANSTGGDLTLR